MYINSLGFVIFILFIYLLYFITPKKYRYLTLLISSYFYYICINKSLVVYLLSASFITYFIGLFIDDMNRRFKVKNLTKEEKKLARVKLKKQKKLIISFGVISVLSFLIILKYSTFLTLQVNSLFGMELHPLFKKIILPLGISYYTLEMISYMVDVFRGTYPAEKNIFKLFLYLSFFPKMLLGPITRYNEMKLTLFSENTFDLERFKRASLLILYGYFKKMVIADNLSTFVDKAYGDGLTGGIFFIAMVFYTIQIYMEFSGCIDIINGVALGFGITMPQNFNQPFFSRSIDEFWRRWNITLGLFLKDYVFYPMSLSKINGKFSSFWKTKLSSIFLPLLSVWILNGFWHGASLKYLTYGIYYFVLMLVYLIFEKQIKYVLDKFKINTETKFHKSLQNIRTVIIVVFGLAIFRAPNLTFIFKRFLTVFNFSNIHLINKMNLTTLEILMCLSMSCIILCVSSLKERGVNVIDKVRNSNILIRWGIYYFLILSIIIFGVYGSGYSPKDFIYGGF